MLLLDRRRPRLALVAVRSPQRSRAPRPSRRHRRPEPAPALPAGDPAAGALAFASVPLGEDGLAAGVTFQGVVLEQRAVGLTVTYPSVSLSTDGERSLAHVRLPTFNCLTAEPPADPVAAGCARSLTEYADLADPQLQVTRDGERVDLAGLFPTYTRPTRRPAGVHRAGLPAQRDDRGRRTGAGRLGTGDRGGADRTGQRADHHRPGRQRAARP